MQKNNIWEPRCLPWLTLMAGALGFGLRLALNGTLDEKGLLAARHPLGILLFLLTALVLAALVVLVRPLNPVRRYSRLFPASPAAGVGCGLAAVGVLFTGIRALSGQPDPLTVLAALLALLAAGMLVWSGICRFRGKCPHYASHTVITVYFMFHLISQYRTWSPEPQLTVYFFPVIASVFLMLTAYQRTCLDVRKGSRRWFVFFNQAALFFCCVNLAGGDWLFYLSMGLWTLTGLCSLTTSREVREA